MVSFLSAARNSQAGAIGWIYDLFDTTTNIDSLSCSSRFNLIYLTNHASQILCRMYLKK